MWDKIWQFLTDNKDVLDLLLGSGIILAVLGGIVTFTRWLLKEYRLRRIRTNDNFPFKIIPPNSNVAKEILGGADDDPLADRNIPYQQRIQGRNTRRELEELIEDHRWILITGRTGLGKTREAVQLAQSLNNEGWTILHLTRETWLDAPAKLPINVPERKLLFFLDDLNKKCFSSKAEIRPDASESLTRSINEPFQTRLQRTLEAFDTFCGKSEIKVVATARDEKSSDFVEPSEWEKLEWEKYKALWEKFKLIDLPEPEDFAEEKLLAETAQKAEILINSDELPKFAKQNDGTFRNLVENLSSAKTENTTLSADNFRDTLKGTWQRRYQKAIQKYHQAKYIYDAVELLREMNIEIEFSSVVQTAKIISAEYSSKLMNYPAASGRGIEYPNTKSEARQAAGYSTQTGIKSEKKLNAVLKHLIKDENILNPRDGQIEAKGYRVETTSFKRKIYYQVARKYYRDDSILRKLIFFYWIKLCPPKYFFDSDVNTVDLALGNLIPISGALNNVGLAFLDLGYTDDAIFYFEKSISFKQKRLIGFHKKRNLARTWRNKARAFSFQKDYVEAITACKTAIEIDKNFHWAWDTLGTIYLEIDDFENALSAFNTATQSKRKWADPWVGLGAVYTRMERYDEAIIAFQKASRLDKKWAVPWDGMGFVYIKLGRYQDAENAYQKALSIAPKWASLWNRLGLLYVNLNKIEDAIAACQKAIAISPKSARSWINLAKVYVDTNKQSDAKNACDKAVELNSKDADDWLEIGHIYRRINSPDSAITAYEKAISINPNEAWAYNGLGLVYEKLKKFEKAIEYYSQSIEIHTNDHNRAVTWDNLSDVYLAQKQYTDAITAGRKAVELDPTSASRWYTLGNHYYFISDLKNALSAFEKAAEINPTRGLYQSTLVSVLRKLGQDEDADERQKITRPLMEKESSYNRACFEAICGNKQVALKLLKLAIEQHEIDLEWAKQDPDFESIRDDPLFKELVGSD